jgi:hypothetical protein
MLWGVYSSSGESAKVGFVFSHHFSFDETLNNFVLKKTPRMRNLFLFFLFVGVALSSLCSLFFSLLFMGVH